MTSLGHTCNALSRPYNTGSHGDKVAREGGDGEGGEGCCVRDKQGKTTRYATARNSAEERHNITGVGRAVASCHIREGKLSDAVTGCLTGWRLSSHR